MPDRRVFATADIGGAALDGLRAAGYRVEVFPNFDPPPQELILERVRSGVVALITTLRDRIDEPVFAAGAAAGLKVVAQDAVGFDNIDRAAANRHRIPFTNTPGVLTDATAEFAFFLLGALARRLEPAERLVRESRWGAWHPYHPMLGDEVTGKTVAVVGLGRIGRAFVLKCLGFAMHVLAVESAPQAGEFLASLAPVQRIVGGSARLAAPQEALAAADFISLHVPLTEQTRHWIDDEKLAWMKPSAYLVNTARGPVVDETALARALAAGRLAGAALDVYEREPLPPDSPLRDPSLADRLRLYPHFASAGRITRLSPDPELGMAGRCVAALRGVVERGDSPFVVNREILP